MSRSIAMSVYSQGDASAAILIKNADMARYRGKETDRNAFSFNDTKIE